MSSNLANIGLRGQFANGSSGWGGDMNRNLNMLDRFTQLVVASASSLTPSDNTAAYIVPIGATGVFAGKATQVAIPNLDDVGQWLFYPARKGWMASAQDDGLIYTFDGANWWSDLKTHSVHTLHVYATDLTASAFVTTQDLTVNGAFSVANGFITNLSTTTLVANAATVTTTLGANSLNVTNAITSGSISTGAGAFTTLSCTGNTSTDSLTVTNATVGTTAFFNVSVDTGTLHANSAVIAATLSANALASSTSISGATLSLTSSATVAGINNSSTYSGTTGTFSGLLTTNGISNTGNIATTTLGVTGATTTAGITNTGAVSTTTLAVSGASTTTGVTNTGTVTSGTFAGGTLTGTASTLTISNVTASTPSVISMRLQAGVDTGLTTVASYSKSESVLGLARMFVPFSLEYTSGGGSGTALRIDTNDVSPEGVVTARPGSIVLGRNGFLYVKSTGTGNTGWKVVTMT